MRIEFELDDLKPVIEEAVRATLEQINHLQGSLGDRLAFTEPEAAALLGLPKHTLRDLRLAGHIKASRVGKRILYSREELLRLLWKNQE